MLLLYRICFVCCFLAAGTVAFAQDSLVYESGGDLIPEKSAYNVHFYELNLKIDPADSTLGGYVEMHALMVHPSNQIALELDPRLKVRSVEWLPDEGGASELEVVRNENHRTFYITFPQTLQPEETIRLKINYGGKPLVAKNPPWDGGFVWKETPSGKPWVAVANQSIGAWVWWPNKDHLSDEPDSAAINITMPDDLVVVSNGQSRGETDLQNGWKTWHWFVSTPINNYNITVNAAPYVTLSEPYQSTSGEQFNVTFWVLPEFLEEGRELFPQMIEQLQVMEEIAGPYPFRADKYGVAHVPYLGMEHQSIIAYGAGFENGALFGEASKFDDLHQHELAHEWWGNLVTAWDWRDLWLHEGFGTYMQALHAERIGNRDDYHAMMEVLISRISSNAATAPRQKKTSKEITQGTRGGDIYYKGAAFLHTLRHVLGDGDFFESLRRFAYPDPEMEFVTDGRHTRFATTDDFLTLTESVSGRELDWLFEVYLRQPALPKLKAVRGDGVLHLTWEVPDGMEFPMPVPVEINDEIMTIVPQKGGMMLKVFNSSVVEIDPDHWILKEFEWVVENEVEGE